MADEILDIAEGTLQDVRPDAISDIIPEAMVRVYPYRMVYSDTEDILVAPQAVAIVSISNDKYTDHEGVEHIPFAHLPKDEGGVHYFEALPAITNVATTEISSRTTSLGLELANEQNIIALTNSSYHPDDLVSTPVGSRKGWVDVFTVGEPYNKNKYEADKQAVYILSSLVSGTESNIVNAMVMDNVIPEDTDLTEMSFTNIKVLEQQASLFRIKFYEGVINLEPKIDDGKGNMVPGVSITVPVTTPIHTIRGEAESKVDSDIDFYTNDPLVPIKLTPISLNEKLTIYADWFDYDMASPLFIANKFLSPTTIINVFTNNGAVVQDGEKLTNLILDILTLSYGYMSEFEGLPRWTSADAANKLTTDSQIGKLKETTLVTSQRIPVRSLADSNPAPRITKMVDVFVRKNPGIDSTEAWKEAKGIISMLSKYTESNYSIGKGSNEFNQAYLPWYLDAIDGFSLVKSSGKDYYQMPDDTKFQLRSRWFDVSGGTVASKPAEDVSEVRLIHTDNRKLVIPEVPPVLQEIDKSSNPADISINSPMELSYMFWLPIKDKAEWEKIYLVDRTVQTNNATQNRTFSTEWTQFGQSDTFTDEFIKKQAAQLMGLVDPNDVQIVNRGTSESRKKWVLFKDFMGITSESGMRDALNKSPTWRALPNSNADRWISLPQIKKVLKEAFNIDYDAISGFITFGGFHKPVDELGSGAGEEYMKNRSGWWDNLGFIGVELKSTRHLNVQVTVAGATVTTYNFETRPIIFDRVEWNRFMKEHNFFKELEHTYKLYSKYETPIKRLRELSISSIFGTYIKLNINGVEIQWDTFSSDDETVGIERVLFA